MKIYLQSCDDSHDNILLPDGITVVVGRTQEMKITDKRCARKQLELTADYASKVVKVKQLGPNPGSIDGKMLEKNESSTLHLDEVLCILQSQFQNKIFLLNVEPKKENKKRNLNDYFEKTETKAKKFKADENLNDLSSEDEIQQKLNRLQSSNTYEVDKVASSVAGGVEGVWRSVEGGMLVYESVGIKHSSRVVAFDLDSTLISTKSGKRFATDYEDWKIMLPLIPKKLKQLVVDGVKLVIISNQNGISMGKVKEEDFKKKVKSVVKALGVPFQVLAATKRGVYRKPNIGAYTWLRDHGNNGIKLEDFVYVGDAAGRKKNWAPGKKKDFSCSDRLFALNINVPFFTPEEYFLGEKPVEFSMPDFDPKSLKKSVGSEFNDGKLPSENQEVIILVGYPACGKSTFAQQQLVPHGYTVVNRDKLKTWQKCVAACKSALAAGKSVVIDNTNPDVESRKRYIECAKATGCSCRCFYFDISIEHAFHNNRFRELSGSPHDIVPPMIIYSHRKKFIQPTLEEGFDDILNINFVPSFDSKELEEMYFMYNA